MTKSLLVLSALFFSLHTCAQQTSDAPPDLRGSSKKRIERPAKSPACYLGFSGGINNPSGAVGVEFNVQVGKYVTFDCGAGPSTWGNKLFAGGKYYLKQAHRGFAFGGGLTFSSGQENIKISNDHNPRSNDKVIVSLKPQPNAFLAAYHYWNVGRKYNRFFVELGKSVPLHSARYHELPNQQPLSDDAKRLIKILSPGGMMAGVGFSFGLYHR